MSEINNNDALKKSENDDSSVTKPRTVTTKKKWTGGIALLAVVLLVGISVGGYFLFKVTGDKKSFANAVGSTEDKRDASCVLAIKDSHNPILEITLTPSKSETTFNEIETKEIEQAIVEAYNNASGGCDDNFKRWMYGINFIEQSSAKHAIMEDEEQSSISHTFDNEYTLVMRLETMISCDGCAEDEAFASVYPTSFGKRASARRMSALLSADLALSSIAAFITSSFGNKVMRMNLVTTMQDNTEIQHASYYQETTTDTPVSAASYYGTKGGKGKGKGGAIGSSIASASIAMAGIKGGKKGGYYGGKKGGYYGGKKGGKAVSAAIENASIVIKGGYYGGKKGGYYGGKKGGKAVSAAIENASIVIKGASCGGKGKGKGFKGGDGDVDCDPPTSKPTALVVEAQTPAPFEYTPLPTGRPTPLPTPLPTPRPTPDPTARVVEAQTPAPFEYTPLPTGRPTPLPTPLPTPRPTPDPTPFPVAEAAVETPQPTPNPTPDPTPLPTPMPTPDPTPLPTPDPTPLPTSAPTPSPSSAPSESPSDALPSSSPSGAPTPCNEDPCLLRFSDDTNNSCDPLVAKIIDIDSWCGVRWDPWCVVTYNDCFRVDCDLTEIEKIAVNGTVDRTRIKCPENIEDAITANTLPPQPITDGIVEDASCPGNFPGTGASCEATNLQCYYFYGDVEWVCNCGANPKEFFCKQKDD